MLLNIRQLMDDAKCYEVVRELRRPDGRNECGLSVLFRYTVRLGRITLRKR